MDERICGVPEERWVDWLQGRQDTDARAALGRHLEYCEQCRSSLREWGELLALHENRTGETPGSPGMDRKRLALRRAVKRLGWRRRAASLGSSSGWLAAAACALAVVIAVPSLLAGQSIEPEQRKPAHAYAKAYEPNAAALLARPDTAVYGWNGAGEAAVFGSVAARPAATIWMNGRTGELFLLLEGLYPSERLDVQAWGASGDRLTSLGLLEFHSSQGHLYSRIGQLPVFKEVAFTIEPKGGSEFPTSPHSLAVRLER